MLTDEFKVKLKDIVGNENMVTDNASLLAYSYDATARYQAMPDAMVAPRSTKEVAAVVQFCNTHKIPIVARGSGTNLCAGTTPTEGGIVLTFKHMNNIIEVDEENLTMTVKPVSIR